METPSTPQDGREGPERSPRAPWQGECSACRMDDHQLCRGACPCTVCLSWLEEPTRSPSAAGGFVSGPQPVLVGEKDGPFLSLADHLELARGKTPQAWVNATAETPIDPADVHSDDAMLSAVVSEGITPLTPVAEEIRVVLNRYSAEAPSGTPDYILANYLIDCLKAFNEAVSLRAVWRGEPIEQMVLHIDKER